MVGMVLVYIIWIGVIHSDPLCGSYFENVNST
jgi:hypothetical protein